ncbi:hypothetical protein AtEden1_Chr5g0113531 [Arabidopsis thaliana]
MVSLVFRRILEVLTIVLVIVILRTRCRHVAFLLQWVIFFLFGLKCLMTRVLKNTCFMFWLVMFIFFFINLLIIKFKFHPTDKAFSLLENMNLFQVYLVRDVATLFGCHYGFIRFYFGNTVVYFHCLVAFTAFLDTFYY